jgi:DNA polymerase III sliding clamp (beta) subunit (PCNA family)
MMKWKLKDIKVARETESEIRKLALETSFGFSNTNNTLEAKYGILVKRQDGSQILPNQIEQIREAWVNIQSKFGGLSTLAKEVKLKISHTGDKFVFSSKASGVYVPKMGTIAVTNKWGADSFQTIFAHETAHFIDNKIGEQKGQRYFSDNFEGKAGVIARTFRNLMNQKSESDYTNCTKECFARAMEQFFAIENFGYGVKLANLGTYVTERDYVSKDNYDNQLRPLIVDFLQSEKDFFKYLVEIEEPQPTNIESGEQPIEPVAETKEEIKADEKAIDELQKEPLQETQKEAEQIKESEASPSVEIPIETKTQPIEQTMENKEEKGQENKPISSTNINNWNVVPSVWKNSKTIKKVTFVNSPYDKSLQTLIKPFLGTDTLRDQFMGINFDQYGITGTNAHILAHIPMPNKEFNGAYLTAVKGAKGDMFEGRYPDYLAVIPKDTQESHPFNAYKLLQYLNVARKFANNNTHAVALKISKDFNVGFNADFLAEVLEFMLKLGHENLYIHASTPSRAFIISPDKNFSAENSLYGLIMPVMIDGYELGARDLDFNKELSVYFDFSKNAVINKDGSVAPFKMEYDNNALLPDNFIEVLNKYSKLNKNNIISIIENFVVENGVGRVSDLESNYTFPAPNLSNGIYRIVDKAVQFQPDYKEIDDYPRDMTNESAETLFAINSDALAYYLEKTNKFEGDDELRPQFSGTHFDYILGSEFNLVATDQHAICIFNIANFVTIKKDAKAFKFTIPTNTLLTFLNSLSAGEPLIIKKNDTNVIFEATTSKFSIRIIDATYPDYKSIIPKSSPIEMDIDSSQLRECLKSKEVEAFIKENKKEGKIALFDKVGEIDGTKRALYVGVNFNKTTENVKRVCSVEIKEQEKEFETPYNIVMIMPIMVEDADKFSFGVEYLKLAIDTIPVENLKLGYRSKVAGIVIDASKVSFATTNLAKENVSKLPPAEAKPKVAPTPTPAPKQVSLAEYERLVTDELISLLDISNSDAQNILEVGNARLVVLRGYKDKESPLSIAKKVDVLSKEPAPTETKKEKLTFDDFHKGRPILIKIAGTKNFADKLSKVFSAFGVRDMATNQPIVINKNAYAYFIDKGKATSTRDASSYENVMKAVNPREISLEELGIDTETTAPAPAPKPAPTTKVETKVEETKAEETEKPKLEVLKARLNLLKKMIKAQPNNTILKTRIKIVSKMIEK